MSFEGFIYTLGLATGWLANPGNAARFARAMVDENELHYSNVEMLRDGLTSAIEEAKARRDRAEKGGGS